MFRYEGAKRFGMATQYSHGKDLPDARRLPDPTRSWKALCSEFEHFPALGTNSDHAALNTLASLLEIEPTCEGSQQVVEARRSGSACMA